MTGAWGYRLEHLERMSDAKGLFEHARGCEPRRELGYCTDDNARMLVVLSREPDEGLARDLSRRALRFVLDCLDDAGRAHNRLEWDGMWRWTDAATTEDCWGRAVWGLGVAAAIHPHPGVRAEAEWGFHTAARQRSPWTHSMAFAGLGAAEVLSVAPQDQIARSLLEDAAGQVADHRTSTRDWPWPEPRLSYASGALAEVLIAAGMALPNRALLDRGLQMLAWLMGLQQSRGHLSVVGVGGRGPSDVGVQFDQQPIEVAALADACWRAWVATGDIAWMRGVLSAAEWFEGANDVGVRMYDDETGGGFDGLTPSGPNRNQGAESTLACISTMQRARPLRPAGLAFFADAWADAEPRRDGHVGLATA
jgi:hypothetical protein